MARPKKYNISLTDDELKKLKSVMRKKQTTKTVRNRCQIIIDLDEAHGKVLTHEQSAKTNCVCMATITNTVKLYSEKGIQAIITLNRNVNSDNARRKFDGRAEARIIEIACSPAPEGHSRWTLRLLEEQAKIVLDVPVIHKTCAVIYAHPQHRSFVFTHEHASVPSMFCNRILGIKYNLSPRILLPYRIQEQLQLVLVKISHHIVYNKQDRHILRLLHFIKPFVIKY